MMARRKEQDWVPSPTGHGNTSKKVRRAMDRKARKERCDDGRGNGATPYLTKHGYDNRMRKRDAELAAQASDFIPASSAPMGRFIVYRHQGEFFAVQEEGISYDILSHDYCTRVCRHDPKPFRRCFNNKQGTFFRDGVQVTMKPECSACLVYTNEKTFQHQVDDITNPKMRAAIIAAAAKNNLKIRG